MTGTLSFLGTVVARPTNISAMAIPIGSARPFIPRALHQNASDDALQYQPVLDYTHKSCYNVPAIGADGKVAEGLDASWHSNVSGGCRDKEHLKNQNVYVRSRCNNGYCAYMYEHYFEKDVGLQHVGGVASGHRHEWENAVVLVKRGERLPRLVAASRHDGYHARETWSPPKHASKAVRYQASHAKLVYDKEGMGTHYIRFAKREDDEIKNDSGHWVKGALVDWDRFPSKDLRDQMVKAFKGTGTEPKISDEHFGHYLHKAIGKKFPEFDPLLNM
ncbi:hypothetical protein E4U41_003827 [Claviceps citrina]|nr:hypothetical protein E4U41_003827 [Claviceps citrina]